MLLKLTNNCDAMCTHCVSDCMPGNDQMMSVDTLEQFEKFIYNLNIDHRQLIITGGEPTNHPKFCDYMKWILRNETLNRSFKFYIVATNGWWLLDNYEKVEDLIQYALMHDKMLFFQVSTDKRYYKSVMPEHKRIFRENMYIQYCGDCVEWLYPMGRAEQLFEDDKNLKVKYKYPHCANLRLIAKQVKERDDENKFSTVLDYLNLAGKFCTPGINYDGQITFGESSLCPSTCSIWDSDEEIFNKLLEYNCNRCKKWMNKE